MGKIENLHVLPGRRRLKKSGGSSMMEGRRNNRKEMEEVLMEYKIAAISGDGIGPEIVGEAKKVLEKPHHANPYKISRLYTLYQHLLSRM